MENFNTLMDSYNDVMENIYNYIKDIIISKGGFINTTNPNVEIPMYSVEVTSGGIDKWKILGLRVIDDRIQYCAEYFEFDYHSDDELIEDYDWYDLVYTDNYFEQTLYNIFVKLNNYI